MTTPIPHHDNSNTAAATSALVDLTHAVVADTELGANPKADIEAMTLRAAKREGITGAEALAAFLPRMKARVNAMLSAIHTDSPAAHTFGHRFDTDYKTHVAPGNEHASAMQDVQSILLNRAAELKAALPLFDDAGFATALGARISEPEPALNTALSPAKLEEIKAALIANGKGGIDAPGHFKHRFLEDHKFHGALMDAYAPTSDVALALEASLNTALPQDDKAEVKAFLGDWLTLRAERARAVMEATRPDGALAQSAVSAWNAQRLAPRTQPASEPTNVVSEPVKLYETLVKEVANENAAASAAAAR